jgi:hypothetical protein
MLLAASLIAQKPPDPQSSFEPRSGPGAGQKFLEKLAGDWNVVKTFYPRSGELSRSTGSCRQTMIHEGRFLQSEFTFDGPSGKTVGLGLIGFEPETGLFTSVWTDSRSTRMSIRRSEAPFNGEEIVLFRQVPRSGGVGPAAVAHRHASGRGGTPPRPSPSTFPTPTARSG